MGDVLNEAALAANRQGRMTLLQMLGLLPFIFIGGIFVLLATGLAGGIIYGLVSHTFKGSLIVAIIIGGGLSLVFLWLAYLIGGRALLDLLIGRVVTIDGYARKAVGVSSSGRTISYYYVEKQGFQVYFFLGIWSRLPEGCEVRAYYTPISKMLMNVEALASQSG